MGDAGPVVAWLLMGPHQTRMNKVVLYIYIHGISTSYGQRDVVAMGYLSWVLYDGGYL
jgi:hypothetical protein